MIIRPAKSANEIIEEGKKLSHCVGGYAQRHADGKTNILMVRKVEAPDEPFFTVEIKKNEIVQCRGLKNCVPTPEVDRFMKDFKAEKLTRKTNFKPSDRQEVAV